MIPATWVQVIVIVTAIVPGFVYQASRRQVRGPSPEDAEASVRILRAVAQSAVFASLYAVALGPAIGRYLGRDADVQALSHVRTLGLLALLLALILPWTAARAVYFAGTSRHVQRVHQSMVDRLHLRPAYNPTPTAWDFAFRARGPGWVRVRSKDGVWIGGYFGYESFATSYPEPHEVYLESGWQVDGNGQFTGEVSAPGGLLVDCREVVLVDFVPDERDHERQ